MIVVMRRPGNKELHVKSTVQSQMSLPMRLLPISSIYIWSRNSQECYLKKLKLKSYQISILDISSVFSHFSF